VSQHLVYALVDPLTREVRYVGRSSTGLGRPRRHWRTKKELRRRDACHAWVRGLLLRGLCPLIDVLDEFDPVHDVSARLDLAEAFWIRFFRETGAELTNEWVDGDSGDGRPPRLYRRGWRHSLKTRRKIAAAHRGRAKPRTHRIQLSLAAAPLKKQVVCLDDGLWFPSICAAARHYGVNVQNLSAHLRGRKHTPTCGGVRFAFYDAMDRHRGTRKAVAR
jgi:hypothetical protein